MDVCRLLHGISSPNKNRPMVYTRNSPALFFIGLVMLAIWGLQETGLLSSYISHLGGIKYKYAAEIAPVSLYFGILSAVVGAWQWLGVHREGNFDYYLSTAAGAMFILLIAMLIRWFVAPEICCRKQGAG